MKKEVVEGKEKLGKPMKKNVDERNIVKQEQEKRREWKG